MEDDETQTLLFSAWKRRVMSLVLESGVGNSICRVRQLKRMEDVEQQTVGLKKKDGRW